MAPGALGRQLAHHKRRLASSVAAAATAARPTGAAAAAAGVLRAFHREPVADPSGALAPEAEQGPEVVLSRSTVAKTLTKDLAAVEKRLARFRMDAELPGVPKTKPLSELQAPVTKVTTLENGLRVATQETYGPLCTFGLVVDAGSRDEAAGQEDGVCHLFEAMAFKSTRNMSHQQVVSALDDLGAIPTANASREQLLLSIDVLRNSVPEAMELFADTVLHPRFDEEEVEEAKVVLGLQLEGMAPELLVKEAIQEAAYAGQPLGRPHFVTAETLPGLTAGKLRGFVGRHLTAQNVVLAAAGVEHEAFVALARKHLGSLPAGDGAAAGAGVIRQARRRPAALYQGGEKRIEVPESTDPFTRVAVGFEVAGWHDRDLVAMCVVQILLGGGDSFSAGGPGKGMYSRLYRELLNRYYWVEGAEAFVNLHNETGVLGIAGACDVSRAGQLMHEFCAQICKLALQPVDPTELSRARNMLKCNVLTQLESRIILFEDLGRQLVTYGHREAPEALCRKIDDVKAEDVMRIARRAISKPVSISALGKDLKTVPTYDQVLQWFQ